MPTSRFVISSYDIAASDENLNTSNTLTLTRFTDVNSIQKSKFFKKNGRTGFKMNSGLPLTMGAGTILTTAGTRNASTIKYDTFTIEFPYYFYKTGNTDKKVEIEKIHLFQRKTETETDYTERIRTEKTILTDTVPPTTTKRTEIITNTIYGDGKYKKIDATIHSTLSRLNTNFDRFICTSNTDYYQCPREFPINDNSKEFDLWCYTLNGEVIDVDPEKTVIVCEFKLTY